MAKPWVKRRKLHECQRHSYIWRKGDPSFTGTTATVDDRWLFWILSKSSPQNKDVWKKLVYGNKWGFNLRNVDGKNHFVPDDCGLNVIKFK
jgi:hypothetical protein